MIHERFSELDGNTCAARHMFASSQVPRVGTIFRL